MRTTEATPWPAYPTLARFPGTVATYRCETVDA
jgi:hypothetical protein